MKKRLLSILLILCLAAIALLYARRHKAPEEAAVAIAQFAPFEQWTSYEGMLESKSVKVIMSKFRGQTTIIQLAQEGETVSEGDLLVEFDSAQLARDIVKLEHDVLSAESEWDSLQHAELPLEKADLAGQITEAQYLYETENTFLQDSRELLKDALISPQEVAQQEHKTASLKARLDQLQVQSRLTEAHLHPARLRRAESQLDALKIQLDEAQRQLEECTIRAPASGMVTYNPLNIGGEYRTVRVGDAVNQNQPFMSIPDMTNLTVACYVPESDLSFVQPGFPCRITPLAFPDLCIEGEVETVGAMAQRLRGKPGWQKYFFVAVRMNRHDPRLRTGLSARVDICSYVTPNALVIPRASVVWENDQPACLLETGTPRPARRSLTLGHANPFQYEVLEGLKEGDRILLP